MMPATSDRVQYGSGRLGLSSSALLASASAPGTSSVLKSSMESDQCASASSGSDSKARFSEAFALENTTSSGSYPKVARKRRHSATAAWALAKEYGLGGALLYSYPLKGTLTPTSVETVHVTLLSDGQIIFTGIIAGIMAASSLGLSALALLALGRFRSRKRGGRRSGLLGWLLWSREV